MEYWYVLFVLTTKETRFVELINKENNSDINAFIPKKKRYFRQKGIATMIEEVLFPGYVFIESNLMMTDFSVYVSNSLKTKSGFIKLLGKKTDSDYISVLPEERKWLEQFTNKKKVIESSFGYIEGDQIVITDGPLIGYESKIVRINRHKRKVDIEVQMFNETQVVSLPCEIVSKV